MILRKAFPILTIFCMVLLLLLIEQACRQKKTSKSEYYSMEDFNKMTKVDIHCHVSAERPAFMEQAVADNFRILTINTDAADHLLITIREQERIALLQRNAFPDHLAYLTTFSMDGWDDPEWQEKTLGYIKESLQKGASGVKVWKNIGMSERDKKGNFIMIDDPGFDIIFDYLSKNHIPVCGHLGEPRNCWLPLEEMTVNNDRQYFTEHPEYHMYLHPDYPSYEEQIKATDNMLLKHPGLRYMGAHLASLEWSLDDLGKHLDMFPNMCVDMAARICHIQNEAAEDWQKVHDFFIKYQDRILYGTDQGDWIGAESDPEKLKAAIHEVWIRDWKFFTTDSIMTSWEVNGEFKGLKLPGEVIENIYYNNALEWFPGIQK